MTTRTLTNTQSYPQLGLTTSLLLHTNQHAEFSMMDSPSARTHYKFVTEPDDELKCLICLGVARDPLQHEECGKLFCKECLEKVGRDKPCPNCRDTKSNYYVDKKSKFTTNVF